MEQLAEWVTSRKIATRSVARHFASWKSRYFVLDSANALLGIRTPTAGVSGSDVGGTAASSTLIIPLSTPSLRISRHNYCIDDMFWLSIKYWDRNTDCEREVVMKFETLQRLLRWKQALDEVVLNAHKGTIAQTQPYWRALREYMKEKIRVHEIASELEYTSTACSGGYYNSCGNLNNEATPPTGKREVTSSSAADEPAVLVDSHAAESEDSRDYEKMLTYPRNLRVPRMCVLLMAVGTRGDIQPFIQLGRRLVCDGHRVRIATHASFRDHVVRKGLEFYPLAGDPVKLSEFMVKTQGCVIPTTPELIQEVPAYHGMMVDIINSCWDACINDDPMSAPSSIADPFRPHAIIANPVCYAHIHCAEALRVPLHLMFPQPWTPTKAFPHPLACLSYREGWSVENFISYQVVDRMIWASFERDINIMRQERMGLEPLRAGQAGWNLINILKVPFVKIWSPAFVPKPKDWPDHIDIVGCFFEQEELSRNDPLVTLKEEMISSCGINYEPQAPFDSCADNDANIVSMTGMSSDRIAPLQSVREERDHMNCSTPFSPSFEQDFHPSSALQRFLNVSHGNAPIVYVGFGSMVVENLESVLSLFLEAAALVGVRIIAQMGWSIISEERFLQLALEAQLKASIVRETERIDMDGSLIFPSQRPSCSPMKGATCDAGATIESLCLSMRSVQSSPDVVSEECSAPPSLASSTHSSVVHNNSISNLKYPVESNMTSSIIQKHHDSPQARRSQNGILGNWLRDAAEGITATIYGSTTKQLGAHDKSVIGKEAADTNDISSAWDEVEVSQWSATKDALFLGPCPHSWLFPRIDAVVHHGGAGTTASGIRYSCPTWICPFFGDQHFWGEMVYRSHLGPRPCPVNELTLPVVTESLTLLTNPNKMHTVATISAQMRYENGVENSVAAFYRHLPLETMLCDVSLFQKKYVLADWYCADCKLKMCNAVAATLHSSSNLHMQDHSLVRCTYKTWSLPTPENTVDGLVQGIGGFIHEVSHGMTDVVYDPVKGIYSEGISGAANGLRSGLYSLVTRPIQGGNVLVKKVVQGVNNAWSTQHGPSTSHDGNQKITSAELAALLRKSVQAEASGWESTDQSLICSEPGGYLEQHLACSNGAGGKIFFDHSELSDKVDSPCTYMERSQESLPAALSQEGRHCISATANENEVNPTKSDLKVTENDILLKSTSSISLENQDVPNGEGDDESVYYEEDTTPLILFRSVMDTEANVAPIFSSNLENIDDLTDQTRDLSLPSSEDCRDINRLPASASNPEDVLAAIGFTDGYDNDRLLVMDNMPANDDTSQLDRKEKEQGTGLSAVKNTPTDINANHLSGTHVQDAAKRATIAAHTKKMVQRLMNMEEQHRRQIELQGLASTALDESPAAITNSPLVDLTTSISHVSPPHRVEVHQPIVDAELSASSTTKIITAYRRANLAQQVFLSLVKDKDSSAMNARFLTVLQFKEVIQQAAARQFALSAPSPAVSPSTADRGGQPYGAGEEPDPLEPNLVDDAIMTNLIQMLCGNKMYIDFVDFVFFCEALGIEMDKLHV